MIREPVQQPDGEVARPHNAAVANITQNKPLTSEGNVTVRGVNKLAPFPEFGLYPPAIDVDHSFRFVPGDDGTSGIVTQGDVYIGGVGKRIIDWPADDYIVWPDDDYEHEDNPGTHGLIKSITGDQQHWLKIDLLNEIVTWQRGTGGVPASTETVEYWEILRFTCSGGYIDTVKECQTSDIHIAPQA
jgi:hypothetical protein